MNHIFPLSSSIVAADGLIRAKYCPSLALLSSAHDARIVNTIMATFWRRIAAHCNIVTLFDLSVALQDKCELQNWLVLARLIARQLIVDIFSDDNFKWVIKLTEAIQGTQIIIIISSAVTKFDSKLKYHRGSRHILKLGCWVGNTVATDYRQTPVSVVLSNPQ